MKQSTDRPKQRSAVLTDRLWERLAGEYVTMGLSSTEIISLTLMEHFHKSSIPITPKVQPDTLLRKRRTVYVTDTNWAALRKKARRIRHKSASALLEQLLRKHLQMNEGSLHQSQGKKT